MMYFLIRSDFATARPDKVLASQPGVSPGGVLAQPSPALAGAAFASVSAMVATGRKNHQVREPVKYFAWAAEVKYFMEYFTELNTSEIL